MNANYVLQQNNFDCGIAALKTIFLQFGKRIITEEIISHNLNQGITALELIKASKKLGLEAKGVKTNLAYLEKQYLPCIAHVIKDKSYFHYIVILKNNKTAKKLTVMDPAVGIITMTYNEFNDMTTNVFIIFNNKKLVKEGDLRFKLFILSLIKLNRRKISLTFFCSILLIFLSLVFSYYLRIILQYRSFYLLISLVFLFISLSKNFFEYLRNKLIINLNKDIDQKINNDFITHIFHLPYNYYFHKTTGELLNLSNDIENFKNIITKIFILCFIDLLVLISIIIFTLFYNIYYSFVFIGLSFFTIILSLKQQKYFYNYYLKYKNSKINHTSLFIESLEGYNTLKNLNIEKKYIEKLKKSYYLQQKDFSSYNKSDNRYNLLNNFIVDIFYIIIIYLAIRILPLLDVVLFSSVFYLYINFLNSLTESISMYKLYTNSITNILDVFDEKEEKETFKKMEFNNITFNDVTFNYGSNPILKNIFLEINRSDKIFIYGKSGAGKSTLIKILLKYLTDYKGNIYLDKINLRFINSFLLKKTITYVSQEEKIFNDTIYNNLKVICDSKEEIEKVIKICEIDNIFKDKVINSNYMVVENGKNLSGGERQKIIIARALLKKSQIIIFDESFNGIDKESERRILKNIMNENKNITIIYISHILKNNDLFNKQFKIINQKIKEVKNERIN